MQKYVVAEKQIVCLWECREIILEDMIAKIPKMARWNFVFKVGEVYVNVDHKHGKNIQLRGEVTRTTSQSQEQERMNVAINCHTFP